MSDRCQCSTSYFFPHRKEKCAINLALKTVGLKSNNESNNEKCNDRDGNNGNNINEMYGKNNQYIKENEVRKGQETNTSILSSYYSKNENENLSVKYLCHRLLTLPEIISQFPDEDALDLDI